MRRTYRKHSAVFDVAVRVSHYIGGAAAYMQKYHSKLFFIGGKHRFGSGEPFEYRFFNFQTRAFNAFLQVTQRYGRGCDNMGFDLELRPHHSGRIEYSVLIVHLILLGYHMEYFVIGRKLYGAGRFLHTAFIFGYDFFLRRRNNNSSAGILALYMIAANAYINRVNI